jgi:hypothetical protein
MSRGPEAESERSDLQMSGHRKSCVHEGDDSPTDDHGSPS